MLTCHVNGVTLVETHKQTHLNLLRPVLPVACALFYLLCFVFLHLIIKHDIKEKTKKTMWCLSAGHHKSMWFTRASHESNYSTACFLMPMQCKLDQIFRLEYILSDKLYCMLYLVQLTNLSALLLIVGLYSAPFKCASLHKKVWEIDDFAGSDRVIWSSFRFLIIIKPAFLNPLWCLSYLTPDSLDSSWPDMGVPERHT